MNAAERPSVASHYGFSFVPTTAQSKVVEQYANLYRQAHGYPAHTSSAATNWFAVCREEHVPCVVGWRILPETGETEVTDLYSYPSLEGHRAVVAAMEYLKAVADRTGAGLVTGTPGWNVRMINAMRKAFGVEGKIAWPAGVAPPALVVHRYRGGSDA